MGWLKGLVIFMGVLIVLGTGALIYTLATRGAKLMAGTTPTASSGAEAAAPAVGTAPTAGGGFGRAVLDIGPGCEIAKTHADQGRLIVRVDGPGTCRKILVLDPATGAVTGRVDVVPVK